MPATVERQIRVQPDGVRIVFTSYGDGESWHKYVIVPRRVMRQWVSKYEGHLSDLIDVVPYLHNAYHGGPGRQFVRIPCLRQRNRRFYVYYQSGGLDI